MSVDWPYKPHFRIPAENIKKRPKKTGWPPKPEPKDYEVHGADLKSQLIETINYCQRDNKISEKEDYVLAVKTESFILNEDSTLKRLKFNFSFQLSNNSAIVTLHQDDLESILSELDSYTENNKFKTYYPKILSIDLPYFERIEPSLNKWLTEEGEKEVELEFLPNLGIKEYNKLDVIFSPFFNQEGIETNYKRIHESTYKIKTKASPQSIKKLLDGTDSIWRIREASNVIASEPQTFDTKIVITPDEPEENAKNICILDTGVDYTHPLLRNVIVDYIDLTQDKQPKDIRGHGTFVSGIAAYGELENMQLFSASAKIISAKVQEINGTLPPFLETYIEEAVKRYHKHSKIFNLSVLYPKKYDEAHPSELSYTIDKLSREYDVLFVVSSGNLNDDINSCNLIQYATYFSNDKCLIYEGADSSNSICVGGIAEKVSSFSVARKNQPSPITRRGTINKSKPDVVHIAGNIECTPHGQPIKNQILEVMSLGLSPNMFARDLGTSFSAPRISNLIARLQNIYPNASANLLKALVIHFSQWPQEYFSVNASPDLLKLLYGKGVPEFNRCAYSTRYSATYILEDEVDFKEESNIPIFVPNNMKQIYGDKLMRITLVYDPPVNRGVIDYNLVDLDYKLYKESTIQRNWDSYFRKPWDNVKTDILRWQRRGWGKEWFIRIIPRTRYNTLLEQLQLTSQKYALIVTLEDPSMKIDIYNAIQNRQQYEPQVLDAYLERVIVSSYIPPV